MCGVIVARATIVTDITAFLPGPATHEQAMLAEQLRDGVAARVILIGIEAQNVENAAPAAQRSQAMAAALRADPRFAFVANGDPQMFAAERDRLFDARYLLRRSRAARWAARRSARPRLCCARLRPADQANCRARSDRRAAVRRRRCSPRAGQRARRLVRPFRPHSASTGDDTRTWL